MGKKIAMHILKNVLPHFKRMSENSFESNWLSKFYNDRKTIHSIECERILLKIRNHNCYPSTYNGTEFRLNTFTLKRCPEKFQYLYHQSNVPPEIILKEGLKIRYSFDFQFGFPPLIFLSRNGNWSNGGRYTYQVEIHQHLYYDTNLNHKCRLDKNYFCVTQNIKPIYIKLYNIDENWKSL